MILLLSESAATGRTEGTAAAAMAELKESSLLYLLLDLLAITIEWSSFFLLVMFYTATDDTRKAKGRKMRAGIEVVRDLNSVLPLLSSSISSAIIFRSRREERVKGKMHKMHMTIDGIEYICIYYSQFRLILIPSVTHK